MLFKITPEFISKNKKIDEFKNKIDEKLRTYAKVQVFKLNELIKERPIFSLRIADHFEISHDNLHLNYEKGIPYEIFYGAFFEYFSWYQPV